MNNPFYFKLEDEDSLIPVDCHLEGSTYVLALDKMLLELKKLKQRVVS